MVNSGTRDVFYHVDRLGELSEGDVLETETPTPPPQMLIDAYQEGGFTRHGKRYGIEGEPSNGIAILEWFLELVRLWQYDEKPSRFQSIFAFETRADAERFISDSPAETPDDKNPIICKVEGEPAGHIGDMLALKGNVPRFQIVVEWARQYWEEESASDDPLWEILLRPGVTVLE